VRFWSEIEVLVAGQALLSPQCQRISLEVCSFPLVIFPRKKIFSPPTKHYKITSKMTPVKLSRIRLADNFLNGKANDVEHMNEF
jgi:hypothetical protein